MTIHQPALHFYLESSLQFILRFRLSLVLRQACHDVLARLPSTLRPENQPILQEVRFGRLSDLQGAT